jgi:hypothetical protein
MGLTSQRLDWRTEGTDRTGRRTVRADVAEKVEEDAVEPAVELLANARLAKLGPAAEVGPAFVHVGHADANAPRLKARVAFVVRALVLGRVDTVGRERVAPRRRRTLLLLLLLGVRRRLRVRVLLRLDRHRVRMMLEMGRLGMESVRT